MDFMKIGPVESPWSNHWTERHDINTNMADLCLDGKWFIHSLILNEIFHVFLHSLQAKARTQP
jgi:hypothetical protein